MIILSGSSGGVGKDMTPSLLKLDDVIGIFNTSAVESHNEKLVYEKLDVSSAGAVKAFAKKWGPNISNITLINAAAVKKDALVINHSEDDWDRIMDVNLKGGFLMIKAFLPYMISQNWGRIIHLSSLGAIQGASGTIAYSAGKSALFGMSRVLAKEYARFNITSNILVLGYFETGLYNSLSDAEKKRLLEKVPSKSLGKAADIANAVEFLIKSGYVNGSSINIDGGSD